MDSQVLPEPGFTLTAAVLAQEAADVATKRGAASPEGTEAIGARLARIRKERGITQTELAERLGISQPIVSDYERGELRLHGELLLQLAQILDVSVDEILGLGEAKRPARAANRRFLRRLQEIDKLPRRDQEALLRTIDAFLSKGRAV